MPKPNLHRVLRRCWLLYFALTGCGARFGLPNLDTEARNFIAVAAVAEHSCVLADDGSLTCWGAEKPHVMQDLPPLRAVVAHGLVTCGITRDARVLCFPRLRSGDAEERVEFAGVIGIAIGGAGVCGWWSDGRARCARTSSAPHEVTEINSIADVAEVAVGERHVCARTFRGDVHCRGGSLAGVLGNGADDATVPHVVALANVTDLASTPFSTCGVTSTGGLACFGYDGLGELAGYGRDRCVGGALFGLLGERRCALRAVRIDALGEVVSVVGGGSVVYSRAAHFEHSSTTCAILRDRSLRCFGQRSSALGFPPTCSEPCIDAPTEPSGLGSVRAVAIGSHHACAIGVDGRVRCWGSGADGQLGVALRESPTPVVVPLP